MSKPEFLQSQLRAPFKSGYGNFINGQWVEPVNGRYFDNISPIHGQKICEVPRYQQFDRPGVLAACNGERLLKQGLGF